MNKLRNKPTMIDGIRFASQKEGRRYRELKLLERAGEISEMKPHPRYPLAVNGHLICHCVPDFSYWSNGRLVVEDVKGRQAGPQYQMFKLKAKLMMAVHGIEVIEV